MDSPTRIRSKPPPEILSPCGSQRRRSSCDSNPPEFEFWRLTNSSFHHPDSDLLSADELFHDGVLLPLHLLSVKSEPNASDCDPDASLSVSDTLATLSTEQKTEGEPGLGSELTREPTVSKRWRDIFRKSENNMSGKNREEKEKEKVKVKEKKKKEKKIGSGSSTAAELNINIWPFSRSRSAGNSVTRPRMSFGATNTRKVSSAPCSRSNSTGESKSTRKWPSSPGRNGVHLGRSSPVWQVRRGAPTGKTISEAGKRETTPETRRGKTVIEHTNKAKVLNLNVPMCIGYRSRLSCRNDESGNIGSDNTSNTNALSPNNPNPNGLFGFRNLFVKKVH